jgi:molybdenum cofactor cytidylyltransferase
MSQARDKSDQGYRVAAVVLAAGRSTRMGRVNKLLVKLEETPIILWAIRALAASRAAPIIVVTGHEDQRVRKALTHETVAFVYNPHYAEGMSASLRYGLAALPDDIDATFVCLGDMPRVNTADIERLIAAFDPIHGREICVPTFGGQRGNPVLWARRFFADMAQSTGDVGARELLGSAGAAVCEVELASGGVLIDVDRPEDMDRIRSSP